MAPKRRRPDDEPSLSSSAPACERRLRSAARNASSTASCLLPLLQPVRHCLQSLLSRTIALRLLHTSRSTAELLNGYSLAEHAFVFDSAAELSRVVAFYSRRGIGIQRVFLGSRWTEPLIDSATGQPLLPASLIALTVGHTLNSQDSSQDSGTKRPFAACVAFDGRWPGENESEREEMGGSVMDDESYFHRRIRPVHAGLVKDSTWNISRFKDSGGEFDEPIPPGALPHGLRFLQLNEAFNQPLEAGSIPDSVEVLQFGWAFNQPLAVGHLPASLTHLVLGWAFDQPILPGVLPAGLRRLRFGEIYDQPLEPGVLPPQLQQLSFDEGFNQPLVPGAIPSSVTHIRLGVDFDQPLSVGSIPHGVQHLQLDGFNHPLLPGVLPTSLRELLLSACFAQPLLAGALPVGLEVLAFWEHSEYAHALQHALPASVVVLSLGHKLVAGRIPSTVKWLRLDPSCARDEMSDVVSPSTHIVWWPQRRMVISSAFRARKRNNRR